VSRLYVDTAPAIYFVEKTPGFVAAVRTRLSAPGIQPVISDLTRMECLVLPIRSADTALRTRYEAFFVNCEVVPLGPDVYDRAAEFRAQYRFKAMDSIHLAAAVVHGCDAFLTNDHQLTKFTGLPVELI
jgi:uncharacterized protein